VDRALRALLAGEPARRAAARAGFVDESHMARHFQRILGVTPGQVEVPRAAAARRAGGSCA
jgi:AraC-like DNA-binding protein